MVDAPSGYKISAAIACFQSARARAEAAGDEEALTALGDATEDAEELLARVLRAVVDAEDMEAAAKARAAAIKAREARYGAQADGLRGTAYAMMSALSKPTLRLPDLTASLTTPRRHVVVTDAGLLPTEYLRTVITPDKAAIAADMAQGVVVDGAEWSNGVPGLTIRTK